MDLRPYQNDLRAGIYSAWNVHQNVLAVLPTGAGKTVIFARIVKEHRAPAVVIAHRQELVYQIAGALAREGVHHRIIGAVSTVRHAIAQQVRDLGAAYVRDTAPVAVASVDTLIKRQGLDAWARTVRLWVVDEAHHVSGGNKWQRALGMFPNAHGLGVTATPIRADGRGLGAHADGAFHTMVRGPSMRAIINMGFLTDYRVFVPPSDLDLSSVTVSATTGDYVREQLRGAVQRSHIVGDIIDHYLRIAPGKLGVTFVPDTDTAAEVAAAYNAAGVPAAVVTHKTPDAVRADILDRFRCREILQLVNVDLFGEGFDLPAIEVVSFARPTQSYALYAQQFGRALRTLPGKGDALIIDHVGNVIRHGLPDGAREFTLDRREKRATTPAGVIPVRACPQCTVVYERVFRECPYCGHAPEPVSRSRPEHVDGDLCELDADTLATLRGGAEAAVRTDAQFMASLQARHVPPIGHARQLRAHQATRAAQTELRNVIAQWAGYQRAAGTPDHESYRRFFHTFGVDVLTAQGLPAEDAILLTGRIAGAYGG